MNINPCSESIIAMAADHALALMRDGTSEEAAKDHAFQRYGVLQDAISAEFLRRMKLRGTPPEVGCISTPSTAASFNA